MNVSTRLAYNTDLYSAHIRLYFARM